MDGLGYKGGSKMRISGFGEGIATHPSSHVEDPKKNQEHRKKKTGAKSREGKTEGRKPGCYNVHAKKCH